MPARFTEERFWSLVRKLPSDGCWEWQGGRNATGYGYIMFQGARFLTHRLSYKLTHGHLPDDKMVCHSCDNRLCVRPDHLWLGTRAENNADRDKKNRYRPPTPKLGQDNPAAILDEATVLAIASATGQQVDIAARFGVTQTCVSDIKRGKLWSSVTGIEYQPRRGVDGLCPKQRLAMDELRRLLSNGPKFIDQEALAAALGVKRAGHILYRLTKRGLIIRYMIGLYGLPVKWPDKADAA